MVGDNGFIDASELHLKYLALHNKFTSCQARSRKTGEEQTKLLRSLQNEIVRFENDVTKRLMALQEGVSMLLSRAPAVPKLARSPKRRKAT